MPRSSSEHSSSSKRHRRSRSHESRNEERSAENAPYAPRTSRTEEWGTGNALRSTGNASRRAAKEVEIEQRHKEEINPSVHDEQLHEEARPKTSKSR